MLSRELQTLWWLYVLCVLSPTDAAHWSKAKSWDKLDAGEDPECSVKKDGLDCTLRKVPAVTGMTCAENAQDPRLYESRCFVPTNDKDGDHRLFTPPREKDRPYLFAWKHARILAGLGLLTVAYNRAEYHASPALAVVPRTLWNLDTYPDPSKSDPSYADGFKGKADLRLVLRPSALRLMWFGILDLLVDGWPQDALAVMETGGYKVTNRDEVLTKVEALCPAAGAAAPADTYCPALRKALLGWWPLASSSSAVASSSNAVPDSTASSSTTCPASGGSSTCHEPPTHATDPEGLARLLGTISAQVNKLPSELAAMYRRILRGRWLPELEGVSMAEEWLTPFVASIARALNALPPNVARPFHRVLDGTFKYKVGELCGHIGPEVCYSCDCRALATPLNMYAWQKGRDELLADGWQKALDDLCPTSSAKARASGDDPEDHPDNYVMSGRACNIPGMD